MAFQKTVNTYPGIGIPGAYAAINPIVSTAKGYVASAACNIGGFVWADADKEGCVKPTGTGRPLGFAVREITNPLGIDVEASNVVPVGYPVSVEVKATSLPLPLPKQLSARKFLPYWQTVLSKPELHKQPLLVP